MGLCYLSSPAIITVLSYLLANFVISSSSAMVVRTYNEELQYLEKISGHAWKIKKGFVPNMKVSCNLSSNSYKLNLHK